jgi:hypothetical protein
MAGMHILHVLRKFSRHSRLYQAGDDMSYVPYAAYNDSRVTTTVVLFTAAKFQPLLSFTLSDVVNKISYYFDSLPAQFFDEVIHVWNFESHMQTAWWHGPWAVASSDENLALFS